MQEEPVYHSIIDQLGAYKIIGLNCQYDFGDFRNSYIDMRLQKGVTIRRLRFQSPFDLKIQPHFPSCSGLEILDISGRQWELATVQVRDFEQEQAISFYAADVKDLDAPGTNDEVETL